MSFSSIKYNLVAVRNILWAATALFLTSCFTGIESTPKITAADVKRENIPNREESHFLTDISGEPLDNWTTGKRFYVTDDKIAIVFNISTVDNGGLKGTIITFDSANDVISITGEPVAEFTFRSDNGETLHYRADKSVDELKALPTVSIPFTIEETVVSQVRDRLKGNTYYVTTSMWYDMNDQSRSGRKYIPVTVNDVVPGNSVYPVKTILSTGDGDQFALFLTTGDNQKAPRNFASLFSFVDPHKRYPAISDQTWQNIINGQVAIDMTKDECRLSIGAPVSITRRNNNDYFYELWTYENGIYLVFQDGILTSFRR